jgi:hypothetical protein
MSGYVGTLTIAYAFFMAAGINAEQLANKVAQQRP